MTIALVDSTILQSASTATTSAINSTGATSLIAALEFYGPFGANLTSVTDSNSNTYTLRSSTSSTGVDTAIYVADNPTVGSGHTLTVTTAAALFFTVEFCAFSGVATVSPFDVQNSATAPFATSVQPGSVTPSQANSLVISSYSVPDSSTGVASAPSGYTLIQQAAYQGGVAEGGGLYYQVQTTATATNPTFTGWTGSLSGVGSAIVVLKPSAGGGITGSGALLEIQDMLAASGSVLVSGSGALVELRDAIAASGTVLVSGTGALLEIQDSIAATGTIATGIIGSGALLEIQDALAATGKVDVAGAAAWTEIQDALAAQGSVTLPAVTGSAAWTEIQDAFAGIGNNGVLALDVGDPGLRKRRKREAAAAAKLVEDYRERQAYRRKQIIDAFERLIEGRSDVPTAMVDEIIAITEMRHAPDELPRLDFTELIHNTVRLQRLWDEFVERDDEEVLVLL